MLRPRTNAEAHLYMDLHPCSGCGASEFARRNALVERNGELVSVYEGPCSRCAEPRRFEFAVADDLTPAGAVPNWGGESPSVIICPGEFLALADDCAQRVPASAAGLDRPVLAHARRAIDTAVAALDEVLKFIPADARAVPRGAFSSTRGKKMALAEPGRFERARLEAVRGAYAQLAARFHDK